MIARRPARHAAPLGAVLLATVALVACARGGTDEDTGATVTPIVGARTATVVRRAFAETVDAIGTVVARAGHVASLGAPAQGRVTRVLVATGQRVTVGQPLVVLDAAIAAAGARSAAAAVAAAQQNAERTGRLFGEGIAPRRDAEQAAAELARARADLVVARRQEQLTTLRAPIAGVVTRMTATLGATADPAQPLVEIVDPAALDIVLGTTPADAARIRAGAPVTVSAGQSGSAEPLGNGIVVDVGAAVDSATRSVGVRVRLGAVRRPLHLGETVFGRIVVSSRPAAVVVASEALVPDGDGFKVFVVDEHHVAHARPVTIGARGDSLAEVTRGLAAGERVVTYGAYGMADSARVASPEPAGTSTAPAAPSGMTTREP